MIQIIKLQNGENLIANVSLNDGDFLLKEPMEFDVDVAGQSGTLVMRHWLPVQLLKKNEIILKSKDVLSVLDPDEEFSEYYLNTVERIKNLVDAKDSVKKMNESQLKEILEALTEVGTDKTYH